MLLKLGMTVKTQERCSDKGFLSMPITDYLELLDASARQIRADKLGRFLLAKPCDFVRLAS